MLGWLLGFLWLAVLKAWLVSHLALDADALGVADLWRSLCAGGHLGDWTMGPHPYVFPDLPLYALAALFGRDTLGRQLWYGLIEGFFFWWFLARLMKRVTGLDGSLARSYSAAGLLLLLPFLNPANQLGQALTPGYHGGALLCGLAFLVWAVGQDKRPSSWVAAVWASILVGLVWASDQMTPLLAVMPALVLSLGLSGQARRRIWGASVSAWLVRAVALGLWERQGMRVAHFSWSYFFAHAPGLWGAFVAQARPAFEPAALLVLSGLLATALLVGRWREERALDVWLAAALLSVGLLGLALSALEGSPQGRYIMGFVWLSVPWLPFLCARKLGGRPFPLEAAALLGLLCMGFFGFSGRTSGALGQARWLDTQVAMKGLKRGLADYDHARPLRLLSQAGLNVLPVSTLGGVLKPFPWIADRRMFAEGERVQFVVLDGLDPAAVLGALGKPTGRLEGEGLTVWLYSRPAGT